jgi:hypothetical protein
MARRFGGTFSPQPGARPGSAGPAPTPPEPPARLPVLRRNLLYAAPLPLIVTALGQPPVGLALDLAACGTLLVAVFLLDEGLKAEAAWKARTIARRPALPRKALATALTGLGVALAAWVPGTAPLNAAILGLVAAALHLVAFGVDPLRNKGLTGEDAFQSGRVARVVDEAEKALADMTTAVKPLGDWEVETRVARFAGAARTLIRTVEDAPQDLTAARRYLTVYLTGARDAAQKYATLQTRSRNAQARTQARTDFVALLDDLEGHFARRTEALMQGGRADLDVEIGVLRDRLSREGIRPEPIPPHP